MQTLIVERLKELMKDYGMNQSRLAEKIGLKQNTISAWLLGKKEPSITSLWLLADFFDIDIDYLVGRTDY
ncbi:MAG: helix-turn-helix domain-containing protein [Firmicutes bacterium]|nr:helix-turn-helix domain-containing protein [Bacillota bacterium]